MFKECRRINGIKFGPGKDLLNNSRQKTKQIKTIIICLKNEVIVSYTELQMLGLDGAERKNQREQTPRTKRGKYAFCLQHGH